MTISNLYRPSQTFINKTILTSLTMEIEITKITSKGQVVIPQDIRKSAGITEGERFFVYASDDSIILKRTKNLEESKKIEKFHKVFRSLWKNAEKRGITPEDVESEITAVRVKKRNA